MEALSDPRAYLSNQEKRAAQLKAVGIDESDINTAGIIVSATSEGSAAGAGSAAGGDTGSLMGVPSSGRAAGAGGKAPSVPGLPGVPNRGAERTERAEERFEPLTADTLKQKKAYQKATKKHAKELDALRKKHEKERTIVQKTQVTTLDKLMKTKGKYVTCIPPRTSDQFGIHRNGDVDVNDPSVKGLVVEQTKQWSDMMGKHRKEEIEMVKAHVAEQQEVGDLYPVLRALRN